jgi:hypothetical protein
MASLFLLPNLRLGRVPVSVEYLHRGGSLSKVVSQRNRSAVGGRLCSAPGNSRIRCCSYRCHRAIGISELVVGPTSAHGDQLRNSAGGNFRCGRLPVFFRCRWRESWPMDRFVPVADLFFDFGPGTAGIPHQDMGRSADRKALWLVHEQYGHFRGRRIRDIRRSVGAGYRRFRLP